VRVRLSHFKLGLLVVVAIVGLVITGFALGIRALGTPTVEYHTYFDESVQGLDLGSPVKFRGVTIGSVEHIGIAPDRRSIDVTLELDQPRIREIEVTPDLRAQLGTQGITGVKFVDIDFADPVKYPPPPLSFEPPHHYIPAQTSLLEGLRANIEAVGPKFPEMVDKATATFDKLGLMLDEARERRIVENLASTADNLARVSRQAERMHLPGKTATTLSTLDRAAIRLTGVLDRFDGERGLVSTTQRAAESIADLGHRAVASTDELEQTIRDLGEAARSIRDLADAVERDPDMLLKGRARTARRR
jgi:phospholipid/cholesterol/gamma-HCH transport system substrate-binding protein